MFFVSLLPCEHFLHTDRIVISSRATSSPSPRAHKSSKSAVTSERPRGPGWHSVSHYILVSRRSDTTPPLCSTFFLLRSFCSIIYAPKTHGTTVGGLFYRLNIGEATRFEFLLGSRFLNGCFIYKPL